MEKLTVPLENISLKCVNFKCFAAIEQGFDRILPINVIIGRNNSGKSSLIDLIANAVRYEDFNERKYQGKNPRILTSWITTREQLSNHLADDEFHVTHESRRGDYRFRSWGTNVFDGKRVVFELASSNDLSFLRIDEAHPNQEGLFQAATKRVGQQLGSRSSSVFRSLQFRRIAADRDVVPEAADGQLSIEPNGSGLTTAFQRYTTSVKFDRDRIEKTLLKELNAIFHPDAYYSRILVQDLTNGKWEVYLEEPQKGRIPLSQTGSGLKTVILVLANLILVPSMLQVELSHILFAFEELENNLHPAIQRRLFKYLRERAVCDGATFFITTHSNVVIDQFTNDPKAQILHVTHDGTSAKVDTVLTYQHGTRILDDLDVRASDLLQANVVVWVEGPSDRIYLKKWIDLWSNGELLEGIHYQCILVGGSSNSHMSFDSPDIVDEMICGLRVNRHAILLADSDRRKNTAQLKKHTERLVSEVRAAGGYAWMTDGREVENYIPVAVMRAILQDQRVKGPGKYANVISYIATKEKKTPRTKVSLARSVTDLLAKEMISSTLDLATRLTDVCDLIRSWNRLDAGIQ